MFHSALSLEPKVINILRSEFNAAAPFIIEENEDQHAFLMKDAGIPWHHYFKQHFNADILIQAIHAYINLQIAITNRTDLFLELGVPNWCLENLPSLYKELISQEALLVDDGLSKEEIMKLKQLEPKLAFLCELLMRYNIKDTFGHADFHDKNILINPDNGVTTIIDLGEVVITYPLFSFHNCLHMAKENFSLTDDQYYQLQVACIKPWLEFETKEHLFDILAIITQCWSIHAVLGEYRLMKSINKNDFKKMRKGRFANKLKFWLNTA